MPTQRPFANIARPVQIIAIALGCVLLAGVATLGVVLGDRDESGRGPEQIAAERTGPLALSPVPAPGADSPECSALVGTLPQGLPSGGDRLERRPLVEPAPPATAAWGSPRHDSVVLRCGLERPAELTPTAQLADVSGVSWLELRGPGATTWMAVDRPQFVALTLPDDSGTGPIQDISAAIERTLPRADPFP